MKNGFDLSKPMQIDFFLAVLSMEKGIKISQIVEKLGFNTSVEQDEETQEWTCYCTKIMIPEYTEIIRVCWHFTDACDNGCFLGDTRNEWRNLVILNDSFITT